MHSPMHGGRTRVARQAIEIGAVEGGERLKVLQRARLHNESQERGEGLEARARGAPVLGELQVEQQHRPGLSA